MYKMYTTKPTTTTKLRDTAIPKQNHPHNNKKKLNRKKDKITQTNDNNIFPILCDDSLDSLLQYEITLRYVMLRYVFWYVS